MYEAYIEEAVRCLQETAARQKEQAAKAARLLADTVERNGIIHVFGCGHSHLLAEELFYRAGGFACVNPVFIEDVMLHKGAVTCSVNERQNGFLERHKSSLDIHPADAVIVVSTSGINPVPVDFLLFAKQCGAATVALSSGAYAHAESRHRHKKRLADEADVWIDNGVPHGDALLELEGAVVPFAPVSTVAGAALLQAVMAEAAFMLTRQGIEPPLFLSGNIPGADSHNAALVERYQHRVPSLRG